MSARRPLNSSAPQAEAPARTPIAPARDAAPHASLVAAPNPHGAATTSLRFLEALAALVLGAAIALAGTVPAAAAASEDAATAGEGPFVVLILAFVALVMCAAVWHGRPRRDRPADERACCLVAHGAADDDEVSAHGVGER